MPRVHKSDLDQEVEPLIHHADEHADSWVVFCTSDDYELARVARWFTYSKHSPFGWSPDGKPQTASRSIDIMWKVTTKYHKSGWTREITAPPVTQSNLRIGRLKLKIRTR